MKLYKVVIIESERGWGQKVDSVEYFRKKENADAFVQNYNKDNTADVAPDWYMVAMSPTVVEIPAPEDIRD